ncbi:MAG: hypothetical protein QNI87_10695 [Erythrobacter sp.]|uniref:hypothetical protein n=1 Tax=Erythrobacter sp. TaxID=1042 RepID=UPI0026144476|nr:hypothetical protein [Erythrobacter sp.]MDJ0978988.1 hypothetical protein [Erythrobacter sp.]
MNRLATALVAMCAATSLAAQETGQEPELNAFETRGPESPPAEAPDPEILVIGDRIPDDEVRDYIVDILFPERVGATRFYAKQGDPLCPAVIGLEEVSRQFVIDRMRTVSEAAGIAVSEDEDCTFNLVLALVDNGPATIKRWRQQYNRTAFGLIPPHARDTVMRSGGPAYAWHVLFQGASQNGGAMTVSSLTGGAGFSNFTGGLGLSDGLAINLAHNNHPVNPYIRIPYPEEITRAFVLVERDALEGVSAIQLADYALMRGMMQIQLRRGPSKKADTILNLFDQDLAVDQRQPSLTRVDLALLVSLYSARSDVSANRQRADMMEPFQRVLAYGEAGVEKDDKREARN